MPVISHTLAGIVLAQAFGPAGDRRGRPIGPLAAALWMPAIVLLSYLPDVVTQAGRWAGYLQAQALGHSFPIGAVAGLAIGVVLARVVGASPRATALVAASAILLHDTFDLLQDAERMPLWPITTWTFGADWLMSGDRLSAEIVVFGLPFVIYETWHLFGGPLSRSRTPRPSAGAVWFSRGLVIAVLASSLVVLQMRRERERDMNDAERLLRAGQPADALAAVARAERWPSEAGDGDLVRGEALERLGDVTGAEAAFLRLYARRPNAFWSVAVLAEFYASHGSAAERQRRAAPYIDDLRRRFSDDPAYARVMAGIERRLGTDGER